MDSEHDKQQHLQLPAVLDLTAAGPLHERLIQLRGGDVAVDASLVERLGGQCLQVLLAARRSWEREKLTFTVAASSDAFAHTLALMGITPDLRTAKETAI